MFWNLIKEDKTPFILFGDLGTETVPSQQLLDGLEKFVDYFYGKQQILVGESRKTFFGETFIETKRPRPISARTLREQSATIYSMSKLCCKDMVASTYITNWNRRAILSYHEWNEDLSVD